MNKHFLKSLRDNIPEPLKYMAAPVFRNKLLKDKNFNQYLDLLQKGQQWSGDQVKEFQLKQLKDVLSY